MARYLRKPGAKPAPGEPAKKKPGAAEGELQDVDRFLQEMEALAGEEVPPPEEEATPLIQAGTRLADDPQARWVAEGRPVEELERVRSGGM